MIYKMCIIIWFIISSTLFISVSEAPIYLYNTEERTHVEAYDCVYYKEKLPDAIVPFCRRDGHSVEVNRKLETCAPGSRTYRFSNLLQQNISVSEVLQWSSSIEVADQYAAYLTDNIFQIDGTVCACKTQSTFGKFCEYELYDYMNINENIKAQFEYRNYVNKYKSQLYGHTLCYTTLQCDSGLLCLDYRDICDGRQQCIDGWDEENCDKLEFNECDDDEYRCLNGMCIPEQFFLDGDWDCMDSTDEQMKEPTDCNQPSRSFQCDEHLCARYEFSCGNGYCISQKFSNPFHAIDSTFKHCQTLREYLYRCELSRILSLWTIQSGRCVAFNEYNVTLSEDTDFSHWSNKRKCTWLVRCALVPQKPPWCPCSGNDCAANITELCESSLIIYPSGRLLNPLVYFAYARNRSNWRSIMPEVFFISGSVKCRGFHLTFKKDDIGPLLMTNEYFSTSLHDSYWCNFNLKLQHRNTTSLAPQYNLKCAYDAYTFTGKPYAFDDVCAISHECISNYRLLDKHHDCYDSLDEIISTKIQPTCLSNKYRFRCSIEQPTCYLVKELYLSTSTCTNYHDIYMYGTSTPISSIRCSRGDVAACIILRAYIRNHEHAIPPKTTIPYVYYCDTFWDVDLQVDELTTNCKEWICSPSEYQCLTGQCIGASSVCNRVWDCSDASDEHGLFAIHRLSDHNELFFNLTQLLMKCASIYPEHQQPFHTKCNRSLEYPCLLANVLDPTDIETNRPCIALSKIGDNIIDCYGSLDERNTLPSCFDGRSMQHLNFHCSDSKLSECISYNLLCKERCSNDKPICFYRRGVSYGFCAQENDFLCLDGKCISNARCNQRAECIHGEDEYWCEYMTLLHIPKFRVLQEFLKIYISKPIAPLFHSRQLQWKRFDDNTTFACNYGMAVRRLDTFVCLCPPTYYGHNCEFYSDRINLIIQLNETQKITMTLVALLLFNDQIIDEYDFRIYPSTSLQKHRFHLLYSRSDYYLKHKQNRYFSRDHIIYFHPYSIQFEIYELKLNESIQLIDVWKYPLYFDYLPSFRFSKILRFESTNDVCLSKPCSINSTCYPILNTNASFICLENCQHHSNICAPNSICKPSYQGIIHGANQSLCICSINRFGPTCHLDYDECYSQPCENNGDCISRYDRTGIQSYVCQCREPFYGDQCQYKKKITEIRIFNISYQPLKLIIHYYDIYSPTYRLMPRYQQIYSSVPILFRFYNEKIETIAVVLLKIYEKYDMEPLYFLLTVQQNTTSFNKTLLLEHPCPPVNTLSMIKNDPHIPDVFKYHRICQSMNMSWIPKCFYDNEYLCMCSRDGYRAECFGLPSDTCSKCLSNGRCVQDITVNLGKDANFLCVCSRCYYGHVCEFSTLAFSFTLDSLIVNDSSEIRYIYLSIALLIFFIGLFNNICAFCTFKRPIIRKCSTAKYLLVVSILSQWSILLLFLKLLHIHISSSKLLDDIPLINILNCKIISYFLSVITRSTHWLLSLVSIERLYLVVYPSNIQLKRSKQVICLISLTLFIVFSMHIHEIFYYTIIKDPNNATLCVINFQQDYILLYDRISVLFHSLAPFIIHILSITGLIIMTARSRIRTMKHDKSTFFHDLLTKQFKKHRELYINPLIIIFSTLPQIILSFTLACMELSTSWKRYILLITYFFSYFPQMLSFVLHVLPSTLYSKEFRATFIYKKIIQKIF